jgi:hypothetical protein
LMIVPYVRLAVQTGRFALQLTDLPPKEEQGLVPDGVPNVHVEAVVGVKL